MVLGLVKEVFKRSFFLFKSKEIIKDSYVKDYSSYFIEGFIRKRWNNFISKKKNDYKFFNMFCKLLKLIF